MEIVLFGHALNNMSERNEETLFCGCKPSPTHCHETFCFLELHEHTEIDESAGEVVGHGVVVVIYVLNPVV